MRSLHRVECFCLWVVLGLGAVAQDAADVASSPPLGSASAFTVTTQSSGADAPVQNASVLLFDNGAWITQKGVGIGGADVSEIETGLITYGFNVAQGMARLADDFTVPALHNWNLTRMKWRSYMTFVGPSSNYTGATVQIWDAAPPSGTVIAGDQTTNRYMSHAFSNVYRISAGAFGNGDRAVIDVQVDMSWVPSLAPGTYFVDISLTGSGGAYGTWTNVTVPWDSTDNGRIFILNGWVLTFSGQGGAPVDFPYELEGTSGCTGSVAVYCTAKVNSMGCTPSIGSTGTPSASAGSGFVVQTTNVLDNKVGIAFYSKSGSNNAPFRGGILCAQQPLARTPPQSSGGSPASCTGIYTLDFNAYVASGADPALVAGQAVWLQTWALDPGSPIPTSLSDALSFVVCP
jgi:hypothetical protein